MERANDMRQRARRRSGPTMAPALMPPPAALGGARGAGAPVNCIMVKRHGRPAAAWRDPPTAPHYHSPNTVGCRRPVESEPVLRE